MVYTSHGVISERGKPEVLVSIGVTIIFLCID
jgi:hypothetical protein